MTSAEMTQLQMVKERLHESFLALALGVRLFFFKVCHFVAIPLMSSYYIIYIYIYIVEISPDHACLSSPGSPSCRNIPAQGTLESLRKRPSLAARRIAAFDGKRSCLIQGGLLLRDLAVALCALRSWPRPTVVEATRCWCWPASKHYIPDELYGFYHGIRWQAGD